MTQTTSLDYLKKYKKKHRASPIDLAYDLPGTNSTEDLASFFLLKDQINAVLADGYQAVFWRKVAGCSHKEIAAEFGIAVATSRSQYSKANKLLRTKFPYLCD